MSGQHTYLYVVNQSFVKVKHEAVLLFAFDRVKEWRKDLGKVGKVVRKLSRGVAGDGACLQDGKGVFASEARLAAVALLTRVGSWPVDAAGTPGTCSVNWAAVSFGTEAVQLLLTLGLDFGQLERVRSELFDVVEDITDAFERHPLNLVHPIVNHLEELFVLVGTRNIPNDVLLVGAVDLELGRCLRVRAHSLRGLLCNRLTQLDFPRGAWAGALPGAAGPAAVRDARERDLDDCQKVLVDVVHQVLQVRVHRSLRVDCSLLMR